MSTTDFDQAAYGSAFIQAFKKRLGVDGSPGKVVTVLRPVDMGPWVTETPTGSFIDVLESGSSARLFSLLFTRYACHG